MSKYQFVKNAKGMRIRVCCASCMWMAYNDQLKRYCKRGFNCNADCSEWQVNDKLYDLPKKATDQSVKVKKKEYLLWLSSKTEEAYKEWKRENPEKGKKFPGLNITQARKEWEQMRGESIYL